MQDYQRRPKASRKQVVAEKAVNENGSVENLRTQEPAVQQQSKHQLKKNGGRRPAAQKDSTAQKPKDAAPRVQKENVQKQPQAAKKQQNQKDSTAKPQQAQKDSVSKPQQAKQPATSKSKAQKA